MKTRMLTIWILLGTFGMAAAQADDEPDFEGLLSEATSHLEGFSSHAQAEAIINLTGAAKSVIIIPDEIAASLIVGYKRGTGAMFRRHGNDWSDPVFLTFSKYSVGFQAGGTRKSHPLKISTEPHGARVTT